MAEQFSNDASTTLAASMGTGDATLTVVSGSEFPMSGNFRIRIDNEIMTVTGVSGVTWTVTRASEVLSGTQVAQAHASGATVTGVLTAGSLATVGGGTGSVTSVSVVTANGVSGTVSNPTTIPAITLTLGAITPSSVASAGAISGTTITASSTISGSNLTGTNTGDQTITLTSDVTGSGTGSFATTISAHAVTYAKMQQASAQTLLGNSTGSTANVQEITLGAGLSFSGGALVFTGSGSGTVTSVSVVTAAGISGSVSNPTTTPAITITIGNGAITNAQLAGSIAASKLVGTDIATVGTITSGTWNGTVIASAYLPSDVAYTDVANTFNAAGGQTIAPTASSSGAPTILTITGPADTGLTASTEIIDVYINLNRTVQVSAGTYTNQRAILIKAPTYSATGSTSITTAATMAIAGGPVAGTNLSIVQPIALWVQCGSASAKGLLVQGAGSQANQILEIQDSSGNTLANFNETGRLGIGNGAQPINGITYGIVVESGSAHERIQITGGSSSGFYITNSGATDGATVRYDSTHGYEHYVSNVLECMQFTITNAKCGLGQAVQSISGAPTAQLHVWANSSGDVVCKVQGASGQSADLQDWINNGSTVLSSVLSTGDITTQSAGVGFRVKEGSNAKMGTSTLSGGTKVVSTTAVNSNSRIFLQNTNSSTTNVGVLTVSAISAGTSFTVTSTNGSDTSTFNWLILDPS